MIKDLLTSWKEQNNLSEKDGIVYGLYNEIGFSAEDEIGKLLIILAAEGNKHSYEKLSDRIKGNEALCLCAELGSVEGNVALSVTTEFCSLSNELLNRIIEFFTKNAIDCGFARKSSCYQCGKETATFAFVDRLVKPACADCKKKIDTEKVSADNCIPAEITSNMITSQSDTQPCDPESGELETFEVLNNPPSEYEYDIAPPDFKLNTALVENEPESGDLQEANPVSDAEPDAEETVFTAKVRKTSSKGEMAERIDNFYSDDPKNRFELDSLNGFVRSEADKYFVPDETDEIKVDSKSGLRGLLAALLGALIGVLPYLYVYIYHSVDYAFLCFLSGALSVIAYILFKGSKTMSGALFIIAVISLFVSLMSALGVSVADYTAANSIGFFSDFVNTIKSLPKPVTGGSLLSAVGMALIGVFVTRGWFNHYVNKD